MNRRRRALLVLASSSLVALARPAVAQANETIVRVVVGASRLVWIAAGGNTATARAIDFDGAGPATVLGQAASSSGSACAGHWPPPRMTSLAADATDVARGGGADVFRVAR